MPARQVHLEEWDHLTQVLIHAAEGVKDAFAEASRSLGLPAPVARALLGIESPTPMRALAEALACDPSYLTGIVDQLENAGLVARVVGSDRRVKLLELTSSGTQMRDRMGVAVLATEPFTARLTSPERIQLARLLEKLLDPSTPS
jgi:DNA-binding MarR family transcriptional regulator